MNIVDRRSEERCHCRDNRRRFLERARAGLKAAFREPGIDEPTFRPASHVGNRHHVLPGRKEHVVGDPMMRPPDAARAREPKGSGERLAAIESRLGSEDFLDLLLEELVLCELVELAPARRARPETRATDPGWQNPAALNLARTLRQSLARRISLRRPKPAEIGALERQVEELERSGPESALRQALGRLETLRRRLKSIRREPKDFRS